MENSDPSKKKNLILQITDEKKRDRQCALWACTYGFESVVPEFPPKAPALLQARRADRASLKPGEYVVEDPSFWQQSEITEFLDAKWIIDVKNRVNNEHLIWVKDHLEPTDTEYLVKVRNRLYDFNMFFSEKAKREGR